MAHVNADNALMFGAEADSLYLGPVTNNLGELVTTLDSALPDGFIDVGWIGEDGFELTMDDSSEVIRGHQNHGVVKRYVSESETSIEVTLLESQLQVLLAFFDAKIVDRDNEKVHLRMPSSRAAVERSGIIEAYDTSNTDIAWRLIFPRLTVSERDTFAIKTGEIAGYKFTLGVLGDYYLVSNTPSLLLQNTPTPSVDNTPTPSVDNTSNE